MLDWPLSSHMTCASFRTALWYLSSSRSRFSLALLPPSAGSSMAISLNAHSTHTPLPAIRMHSAFITLPLLPLPSSSSVFTFNDSPSTNSRTPALSDCESPCTGLMAVAGNRASWHTMRSSCHASPSLDCRTPSLDCRTSSLAWQTLCNSAAMRSVSWAWSSLPFCSCRRTVSMSASLSCWCCRM